METRGELLASSWAKPVLGCGKGLLEMVNMEVNGCNGLLHLTATWGKRKSCIGRSENWLSCNEAVILVVAIDKWLGMIGEVTGGEQAYHSGKK